MSLRYEYDIYATHINTDKELTFEVKNDVMASRTGNVAVEFHNSKQDKPSGIDRTTALFWTHKLDADIWIISVAKLREFLKKEIPHRIIIGGGDDNANLYLYKKDIFQDACTNIKDITCLNDLLSLL
jgi:hypothetical protein